MASERSPIKTAVIGMGMSATVFHIPFIRSLPNVFALHSIMERSATAARSAARDRYGNDVKVVNTFEEVVGDAEVECVVISTPNSTHFDYAKAALSAGKNVIIEKPLVLHSSEATELIALAHSRNLVLATYQNRRFDSDFLTLRKLLSEGNGADGVFGDITEFESHFDRFRPALKGNGTWKELGGWGQGVVFDLGSHLIDQALTLFGRPTSVYAHIENSRAVGPADLDDSFTAHLYYKNRNIPLTVIIRAGTLSLLEKQLRFSVKGTRASWVKLGLDTQEDQLKLEPPMSTSDPSFGVEPTEFQGILTVLGSDGKPAARNTPTETGRYLSWYENVGAAIAARDSSVLHVKPEQARDTIRIIELLYQSNAEGRRLNFSSDY
ncbi:hypothetical protein BOTBODRAFT_57915 [Botryobasidium botryosum FD-172 SS1]|uniref:Gfo/Idh/MocA-like oxidoreductase N-terminal domain-containing protein n=1 Tax=Botryobasidium botryosum (strain FD-172 SS1) TaxID=930990 RepID=A0A067MFP4_BOTB1|nr:hypothetical protein BOTBODRAFT_57915 [Botryobasidium botryosum FD-172 SS1]